LGSAQTARTTEVAGITAVRILAAAASEPLNSDTRDHRKKGISRYQAAGRKSNGSIEAIDLYEGIGAVLHRFPGVLLTVCPNAPVWVVLSVIQTLDWVVGSVVLEIDQDLVADDQQPAKHPKYVALLRSRGIYLTAEEWESAIEERAVFVKALNAALFPEFQSR
jgi:hypothetical protein